MLNPGQRLHTYRIARTLEASRTGLQYEATHVVLPRRALVKVAHASGSVELLREVCILDALHHPGVPRVFDADLLADKRSWFAREWLAGETAGAMAARGGLSAAAAVAILRDVAETLAYIHHRGVIHGDLYAESVLVTPDRAFRIAIIDWSEAATHDADALHFTRNGRHLAPEWRCGEAIDDRVDVYALGVLGARLLTGHGSEVSPVVTSLVQQMLADKRYDRPSAGEVCAALTEHIEVTDAVNAIEPVSSAAIVLPSATDAMPLYARIRRPRWTPPIEIAALDPMLDLSDAIELLDDDGRS